MAVTHAELDAAVDALRLGPGGTVTVNAARAPQGALTSPAP